MNPRGDNAIGTFELQFTFEHAFSFSGGGLIILFSNPSASYAADGHPDPNLVAGTASDTSGYFVKRFFRDADGVTSWGPSDTQDIGAFRVTTADTTVSATPEPASTTLLGIGGAFGLLGYRLRRRKTEAAPTAAV